MLAPLTWAAGVNLPAAAGGVAALSPGSIEVFGGGSPNVTAVSAADPTWQAFTYAEAQLEDNTTSPGLGTLSDGTVLVYGGGSGGDSAIADASQYSYTAGVLQVVASMHTPRALLSFATDNYQPFAIGGIDDNGTPLSSVEYYTQSSNTWTTVASLPQTLYSASAVDDGNGHIFTFGGVGADGTITSNVYEYTVATDTWSQVASMPVAVRDSAAVLASNGLIYVLGGTTASGATADVESYNPSTNTWNAEAPLPNAVSNEAAASDYLGRIEVLGGYDASGNALANVWISQRLNAPDSVPNITSTAPTTAWTGTPYTYQVFSTANPQATYSLGNAPTGMTIDSIKGLISWAPSQAQVGGLFNVTVQANNYAGQGTQTFSVTVKQSPPTVPTGIYQSGATVDSVTLSWNASTGPIGVDHYNVYHYYGTGHSGRGGGITYHYDLLGSTTTPTFTITGLYSGSSAWYTIKAFDPNGLSSGYSSIYTGKTLPDTVAPVLTVPANQTVIATSLSGATDAAAFTATAYDPGPGLDKISIVYIVGQSQIPTTYVFPIGTTTVTAFAEDLYGNYTTGTFTVTVVSSFPVLSLPANQTVEIQSSAGATDANAFTATATDPQDSIASITYAVNNTQIDPTYVFAPGTTTVTVTATDTSGYSTSGTFTVTVEDIPPTLTLSGLPTNNSVSEGTALNLTASGSAATSAENAYGLTFNWTVTKIHNGVTTANFASGTGSGSSIPIAFTADDDGTFTLSVTATDVNGAATTVNDTITATTAAPTTGLSGPTDAVPYQSRQFTLTASSPSPIDQANPFTFSIDWGDGSSQSITANSGATVSHVFTGTGTFPVSVYATDKDGAVGNTVTQNVAVQAIQQENDPASQGGSVGLVIGGTSGNDSIQITTGSTSGTVTVTLNGTSLGTYTPTGNSLLVFGGPGTDSVTFVAPSGAGTYNLTGQTLGYSNSGSGIPLFNLSLDLAPDIENLIVQGGNTSSAYQIQDATVATTLSAGLGNDTFTFADSGAATQAVTVNGRGGMDSLVGSDLNNTWNLTGPGSGTLQAGSEPADTFSGITNLAGGSGADTFRFASNTAAIGGSIDGKGGANTLDYSGRTTAVTTTLVNGGLNKGTAIGGTWTNVQTLIGSQAATDMLIGPNATTAWTISGADSGTVAGVAFSGMERLTGGSGNDTFVFSGGGNLSGTVNGGGGTNTIDLSASTSPATIDLQTKTATPLGGKFNSISSFVGDNSTSTLIGPNSNSTWSITAANKGAVGTTSFSGFTNLTGGTGNDTFKLANGVGVTGTIDGGAGANTLDYSAYTTSIIVDLMLPTATNTGAIKNIQNVNSGTGNSILVGNGGSDNFTVKGGHNLVIGGGGAYKLTGGTGQDILIAGTTSYDANLAALTAILAYWGRTDLTYAEEVSGLSTTGVSYQDGTGTHTAVLNTSTVLDNSVVDTLVGGAGLDWFFAHQTGTNQDVLKGLRGGEVVTDI